MMVTQKSFFGFQSDDDNCWTIAARHADLVLRQMTDKHTYTVFVEYCWSASDYKTGDDMKL